MHRKHLLKRLLLLPTLDSEEPTRTLQDDLLKPCKAPPNCAIIEHQPWNLLQPQIQCSSCAVFRYIASLKLHTLKQPFPHNEQLLKREQVQNMDALDWATGSRPNRPFQNIYPQSIYEHTLVHKPRRPPLHKQLEPTEYFKEQLFLARDGPAQDPDDQQPLAKTPQGVDLGAVLLATPIILPLLSAIQFVARYVVNRFLLAICLGVARPFKSLSCPAVYHVVIALVFATQMARLLPGMAVPIVVKRASEVDIPVYTVHLAIPTVSISVG